MKKKKPINKYKLLFQTIFISLVVLGIIYIILLTSYVITLHRLYNFWQEIYVPTDITNITENVNETAETKHIADVSKTTSRSEERYKITAYCPCIQCCGKTDGITASGVKATPNHTIATSKEFPFGTKIEIDGIVYTVEDRGGAIQGNRIDVFFLDHQSALNYGVQYHTIKVVE